jgi:hypothetical protein
MLRLDVSESHRQRKANFRAIVLSAARPLAPRSSATASARPSLHSTTASAGLPSSATPHSTGARDSDHISRIVPTTNAESATLKVGQLPPHG